MKWLEFERVDDDVNDFDKGFVRKKSISALFIRKVDDAYMVEVKYDLGSVFKKFLTKEVMYLWLEKYFKIGKGRG